MPEGAGRSPGDRGHGPPWGGPAWRHGDEVGWGEGRPPWWPADEPFPPDDWHRVRRRFFRRALVAVLVILAVLVAIGVAAASLGARHPGAAAVAVAAFVVVLVLVLRAFRRTTAPIAEVMAAADRVAAGDLGTRVTPSGPRATRRLGAAFNQMAERLEAQERHRRELFADVAHELRTPLAVLRGNLEGIVDGIYAADGTQLGLLVDQTDAMARLLEDLQTLSTAEAGALTLHREPTDVGALLRDAVAAFGPSAQRAGVSLTAEIGGDLPTDAELDPVRIGEVLRNLVVNAIRHTPAGGVVTVSAAIHEDGIRIAVSDTGRGIDADELPRVFDRFVRSADSGGHGLGLAIARALVEAHHGTISVESTAGAGATFRVDLPIGPAS